MDKVQFGSLVLVCCLLFAGGLLVPLRSFGSVSKPEIVKSIFVPVTWGTVLGFIGGHTGGATLNGLGNVCGAELEVPVGFTSLRDLLCIYEGNANQAGMNLVVGVDYGSRGQQWNIHTANMAVVENTVVGQLGGATFVQGAVQVLLIANPPVIGDFMGLEADYTAAAPATNLFVLGFRLSWW